LIEADTLSFPDKMKIVLTDSNIPGGRYHNRRDYMDFPSLEDTICYTKKY
jgi:polyphosphate kinase